MMKSPPRFAEPLDITVLPERLSDYAIIPLGKSLSVIALAKMRAFSPCAGHALRRLTHGKPLASVNSLLA
jgi:hypothetical protein